MGRSCSSSEEVRRFIKDLFHHKNKNNGVGHFIRKHVKGPPTETGDYKTTTQIIEYTTGPYFVGTTEDKTEVKKDTRGNKKMTGSAKVQKWIKSNEGKWYTSGPEETKTIKIKGFWEPAAGNSATNVVGRFYDF